MEDRRRLEEGRGRLARAFQSLDSIVDARPWETFESRVCCTSQKDAFESFPERKFKVRWFARLKRWGLILWLLIFGPFCVIRVVL